MSDQTNKPSFPIKLFGYMLGIQKEFLDIPQKRKDQLIELAAYISKKIKTRKTAEIIVICTHNSRRSHMGQIWLKMAAAYYGLKNLRVFSGGTEATAFHSNAVKALRHIGFVIEKTTEGENPFYECEIGNEGQVLILFSKKYGHHNNPQKGFAALMVCSDADEACPIVPGAERRFAITYEDPKAFDGTDQEDHAYLERSRHIAREMFFVIKNVG